MDIPAVRGQNGPSLQEWDLKLKQDYISGVLLNPNAPDDDHPLLLLKRGSDTFPIMPYLKDALNSGLIDNFISLLPEGQQSLQARQASGLPLPVLSLDDTTLPDEAWSIGKAALARLGLCTFLLLKVGHRRVGDLNKPPPYYTSLNPDIFRPMPNFLKDPDPEVVSYIASQPFLRERMEAWEGRGNPDCLYHPYSEYLGANHLLCTQVEVAQQFARLLLSRPLELSAPTLPFCRCGFYADKGRNMVIPRPGQAGVPEPGTAQTRVKGAIPPNLRNSIEASLGDLGRGPLLAARDQPMIELTPMGLETLGVSDRSAPPPLLHLFEGNRAAPLVTSGNRCLVGSLEQVAFLLKTAMKGTETQIPWWDPSSPSKLGFVVVGGAALHAILPPEVSLPLVNVMRVGQSNVSDLYEDPSALWTRATGLDSISKDINESGLFTPYDVRAVNREPYGYPSDVDLALIGEGSKEESLARGLRSRPSSTQCNWKFSDRSGALLVGEARAAGSGCCSMTVARWSRRFGAAQLVI